MGGEQCSCSEREHAPPLLALPGLQDTGSQDHADRHAPDPRECKRRLTRIRPRAILRELHRRPGIDPRTGPDLFPEAVRGDTGRILRRRFHTTRTSPNCIVLSQQKHYTTPLPSPMQCAMHLSSLWRVRNARTLNAPAAMPNASAISLLFSIF